VSASEHSKEVTALVKRLRGEYGAALDCASTTPPTIDPAEPLLGEFVRSFLIWEATTAKAAAAMTRLEQSVVDFNELRVCLPDELTRMMGERYPRVEERSLRMRAALNEIYHRQHAVTLEPLMGLGKREAKDYLDSLDGVPRFVSSRVFLLCLGGHAAPVDGRITRRLIEAEVADTGASPDAASATLERKVRAGEMGEVYRLLQAWADEAPANYSETPSETPRRREKTPVAAINHHAEAASAKPGKGGAGGNGGMGTGKSSTKKKSK
jgi:hypothetical protein